MILTIGSEGKGIFGKDMIIKLINRVNQDIEIKFENNNCDIIVRSVFVNYEDYWNTEKKKYIYWSGEYYHPNETNYNTKKIYIITTINNNFSNLYIPYFLYSSHLYKPRICPNINRKFFLAYCSSHYSNHREDIYNAFVENTTEGSCHALGKCFGKHHNTQIKMVANGWDGKDLIEVYSDYKFVLAIENTKFNGYVTEKIVNAFYSGAIPIYWGCDTVNNYFNKNAFININDFSSYEECIKHVINMDDETIQRMSEEPIYNPDNEIANLFNDEYNSTHENKTLNSYLKQIVEFLE